MPLPYEIRQQHQEVDDDAGPFPASIYAFVDVVRLHPKIRNLILFISLQ